MIRLVINNDTSQKFWQIHKNSNKKIIEINWGKIGGKSRTKQEPYTSDEQADKLVKKMIEQKIAKGYEQDTLKTEKLINNVPVLPPKIQSQKPKLKTNSKEPPKKTQKRKRCPNGMKKNENNECVPKNKAPTPKAPSPEKKTQKRKRCPNGMRRDENGNCVSKNTKKQNTVKKASKKNKVNKSMSPVKVDNLNLKKREVVYDVIKNGVMLAHTYKDPKTGKLKNPPKGFPAAPKGWYASEKFDGYRAIWDGKDFRSRTGKVFAAPEWFKSWLPSGIALDGELFMGRECFEKCGIFRKKVPDDKEWKSANVTYQIFDVPSMKVPFEERMEELNKLVKKLCKQNEGVKDCPLRITKQVKVETEEEVFKMFDNLVEKGAEGVMLRSPKSPYDPKRSAHLLKVKPFFDAECSIIGYKPGTGKYSGKLGAFHCETVKEPKTKFFISGMTDEVRENYKKTHPIGTKVTYTYVGVNESGVPRHPNYLRKREAE